MMVSVATFFASSSLDAMVSAAAMPRTQRTRLHRPATRLLHPKRARQAKLADMAERGLRARRDVHNTHAQLLLPVQRTAATAGGTVLVS
jgi:hypothetical protein